MQLRILQSHRLSLLLMERVSPTVRLGILAYLLAANLLVFPILRSQYKRLGFWESCRQAQTWIMIANLTFDLAFLILAVITSKHTALEDDCEILVDVCLLRRN